MTFQLLLKTEIVKDVKEKLGYIALDYTEELSKFDQGAIQDPSIRCLMEVR